MSAKPDSPNEPEIRPKEPEIRVETSAESAVVKSISVTVDAKRVDKTFDRAYRDLRRTADVKGFRKGKVPRSVLERVYGAAVPEEVERLLVSSTLTDAVELSELQPIVEPDVDADRPEPGTDFHYTLRVEVRPEVELPDLASLTATKTSTEVAEETVNEELDRLRERNAPLVEEPDGTVAEEGHSLTIDFEGRVDGELFEGGKGEGVEIELGAGRFIPGFEEQLIGASAGDDREVNVTFPEDYNAEALRAKDAVFAVKVVAIKQRKLADLDDEFAKDLGEFDSLDELRARIRTDLEANLDRSSEAMQKRTVMDSLLERVDFEVPPGVVERELEGQLSSMHRQYHGQVPDEILHAQLARMREEGRDVAERRVREAFALDAVATLGEVEVTDEDIDARLGEMAEAQGIDFPKLRSMADEQGWDEALRHELREKKALDFLLSEATVEEVSDEDSEASAD